jgi:hypothetical protein
MSSLVLGKSSVLKVFRQTAAFLNRSGQEDLDIICTESCQPLILADSSQTLLNQFIEYLISKLKVDCIVINAVPARLKSQLEQSCKNFKLKLIEERRASHYSINLEALRISKQTHLSSLSGRTRGLVKKTIEKYESEFGKLKIEYAANVVECQDWLESLMKLNIARLDSKNRASSFNIPFLQEFQNELIEIAFPKQEILMARIKAGETLIGYIYGYLYNQTAYIYQTGFVFEPDNKFSPGLMAHHLVAQDALDSGVNCYDFLAGDYRYKQSLSNQKDELIWLRLQKPTALFLLDQSLRKLKRKISMCLRREIANAP